jgi:hypothetical protein
MEVRQVARRTEVRQGGKIRGDFCPIPAAEQDAPVSRCVQITDRAGYLLPPSSLRELATKRGGRKAHLFFLLKETMF